MTQVVVPFRRELRLGSTGKDVRAVKRALRKVPPQDSLVGNTTRVYGPGTVAAVKRFELERGLPIDGVYDAAAHEQLAPYFDSYGAFLMGYRKRLPARARLTACAVALRNYQVATGHVHYTQTAARMTIVRGKLHPDDYQNGIVIWEDCSSSVTGYYWQAGLPDPNGRAYDGQGYTGTLCLHGVEVPTALPGDLIFYGRGRPWHHVAIAVGDDPWKVTDRCVTHGHEGGPFLSLIDYRSDRGQIRSYLPRTA